MDLAKTVDKIILSRHIAPTAGGSQKSKAINNTYTRIQNQMRPQDNGKSEYNKHFFRCHIDNFGTINTRFFSIIHLH